MPERVDLEETNPLPTCCEASNRQFWPLTQVRQEVRGHQAPWRDDRTFHHSSTSSANLIQSWLWIDMIWTVKLEAYFQTFPKNGRSWKIENCQFNQVNLSRLVGWTCWDSVLFIVFKVCHLLLEVGDSVVRDPEQAIRIVHPQVTWLSNAANASQVEQSWQFHLDWLGLWRVAVYLANECASTHRLVGSDLQTRAVCWNPTTPRTGRKIEHLDLYAMV